MSCWNRLGHCRPQCRHGRCWSLQLAI
ncbi:hypothetical protein DPM33_19075 [Mesorhizobium hawassense]|uniref:Uncharacterized protein n=1 Tax=Mesorhizobium hawassense TaxID=1209954 RepID=A0A330HK51_9HYPH|nr:hypothetical protein DPM33_19075 [Mesorhizobium hawassense]